MPADGLLFYGYGHDRIAGFDQPGEGHAVYDDQGLPVWTPATGVAVAPGVDFDTVEGRRSIRFSAAGDGAAISEALERLAPVFSR